MPKPKRVNKTKPEILEEMRRKDKVNREKALCKLIWPHIENQETIYDAQTVLNALSGYITFNLQKKQDEIKVSDINLDFSKEPESKLKVAIVELSRLLSLESAKDTASLLERFGKTLAQYAAAQYLKNPMKDLNMGEIIA